MTEQLAQTNGIEMAYETFGDPGDPPLLLVMGLGMQMVGWDPDFCELLAGEGFHVIRFDNRDVGRSTKIRGGPKPNVLGAMLGRPARASYKLRDMAADAMGLLDHLEAPRAHVVGASMGGMIAQTMALEHPDRVLSLASVMSTTGERRVGRPRLRAFGVLLRRAPSDREAFIEYTRKIVKTIGSPGFPPDDKRLRRRAGESFDRCYYPAGIGRQLMAVMASGDRTERLRGLEVSTVVIHGKSDPLIPVRAGRATAAAIPGAELVEIDGWGHDLPVALWPRLVEAIVRNASRAEEKEAVWR
jgi:pimeloyl-ACP methyl ester carboxylesterase